MARILATAKQRGSVNALVEPIRELQRRGHKIDIYATGNDQEVSGFRGLNYQRVDPNALQYESLLKKQDLLLTGLSGKDTPDGYFIRAANKLGIKSIGVNDQNTNYKERFGDILGIPNLIALMSNECIKTMAGQLPKEMAEEARKKSRVVGWTAFDNYSDIKYNFTNEHKENIY